MPFDFSKAFDMVSHRIVSDKLKSTGVNPYIVNWVIDFLSRRKQRVCLDNARPESVPINRGVPQGTVLGPILFSVMVNDVKRSVNTSLLVKLADDITVSVPVRNGVDNTAIEVDNIL